MGRSDADWLRDLCNRIPTTIPAVGDATLTERIDWRLNGIACRLEQHAADLGRAREEIATKEAEIARLTKLLTPYIQQEERLAWLIGDPSKQGVVMEATEDPYIIINGQPSIRPAAKDDEGGGK